MRRRRAPAGHGAASLPDHGRRSVSCALTNPFRYFNSWLARHPNVHFHFTPTHASWLNQVEVWFSILARAAFTGASFTSPTQIREAIVAFGQNDNQAAVPFEWRAKTVYPTKLKSRYRDLRK